MSREDWRPLVSHYRRATRELEGMGEEPTQARLDMHVISQIDDAGLSALARMTWAEYRPRFDALSRAIYPERARVMRDTEDDSRWLVTPCACCVQCGLICGCEPCGDAACERAGMPRTVRLREMMVADYLEVAPDNVLDEFLLVARLSGEEIDAWPYGWYRTIAVAAQRMVAAGNPSAAPSPERR